MPLYDYQREGALFAARAGRCLIGDEMGLGKTIQAIAAAEIMARLFGVERVLIVCPTSLKHQWQREIERFTDRTVAGHRRPAAARASAASPSRQLLQDHQLRHRPPDLDLIDAWAPDLVILDEAQRIKNWNTRVARSVKKIASPYAIVLTGTPLENRLEELISIVQFVDRYRLGPTFRLLHEHQVRDERRQGGRLPRPRPIGQTLEPILLRRQKDQVLDQLPERIDKQRLRADDAAAAASTHEENQEIVARIVQKWRRYRFLSEADQRRLMIALQHMRMACDSTLPASITQTDHGLKADEVGDAAGRDARAAGDQGGGLQPVAADARAAGAAARRSAAGATCCSTAACPAASARTWSTGSATTRSAGCSCRPTRAASG